jgi:hypothetical protein
MACADRHHGPPPQKFHPAILGTHDEALVQRSSPHSHAGAGRKVTRHSCVPLRETNAPKTHAIRGADRNTQIVKRRDRFRHHPFAAWFFDRRRRAVGNGHSETLLAGRNRRSETGWASANNKYVGHAL